MVIFQLEATKVVSVSMGIVHQFINGPSHKKGSYNSDGYEAVTSCGMIIQASRDDDGVRMVEMAKVVVIYDGWTGENVAKIRFEMEQYGRKWQVMMVKIIGWNGEKNGWNEVWRTV